MIYLENPLIDVKTCKTSVEAFFVIRLHMLLILRTIYFLHFFSYLNIINYLIDNNIILFNKPTCSFIEGFK